MVGGGSAGREMDAQRISTLGIPGRLRMPWERGLLGFVLGTDPDRRGFFDPLGRLDQLGVWAGPMPEVPVMEALEVPEVEPNSDKWRLRARLHSSKQMVERRGKYTYGVRGAGGHEF